MSKSRRPSKKKRVASATRRKSATKRSRRKVAPKARPGSGRIELKPVRAVIAQTIERLNRLEPTDRVKLTVERLQRCVAEFDDICDPQNPEGCGPDMAFPPLLQ